MGRSEIQEYYARRAPELDLVYEKSERQADLRTLRQLVSQLLAGYDVLELACGTGYWTQVIAESARSILATDICPEVLSVARQRGDLGSSVKFALADASMPMDIEGDFTAALVAFWWSHIPRQDLPVFLNHLSHRLGSGARLVFLDNRYVEGSSTPISDVDRGGNSYQIRHLRDGSTHRVLKNFTEPHEIRSSLARAGVDIGIDVLEYYWCAWCTTAVGA